MTVAASGGPQAYTKCASQQTQVTGGNQISSQMLTMEKAAWLRLLGDSRQANSTIICCICCQSSKVAEPLAAEHLHFCTMI
jgi:hypothetical protein